MAPRIRFSPEEIQAAQLEARKRMKVASVANREMRRGELARVPDDQPGQVEHAPDGPHGEQGELERVPTNRERAVEKLGGGAVPGELHSDRGDYRTVLKGGEVHHIYGDGTDRHFKVDNMAERQALAEQGVDYGAAQKASGQDPGTFRSGMAGLLKADPSVRQQWMSAIAKQTGAAPVSGQDQPVGHVKDTAGQLEAVSGGVQAPESQMATARQHALAQMQEMAKNRRLRSGGRV